MIGFDINPKRIAELQAGTDGTLETMAEELREAAHCSLTTDLADLVSVKCDFVTVPTRIDAQKRPDLTPLIKASEMVGRVLEAGGIVIYESTVHPGCIEEDCVPILEPESGLRFNRDFSAVTAQSAATHVIRNTALPPSKKSPPAP